MTHRAIPGIIPLQMMLLMKAKLEALQVLSTRQPEASGGSGSAGPHQPPPLLPRRGPKLTAGTWGAQACCSHKTKLVSSTTEAPTPGFQPVFKTKPPDSGGTRGGLPHQVPTTCAHQGGGQSHSNLGHPLNWARAGLPRTLAGHTAGVQLTLAERVNDGLVAAPWRAPGPLPEAQGRRHPWKPSPCRPRGREGAGTLAQGQLRWAVAPGQALQRQPRCQLKAVGGRGRKGIPAPGGEPPGPEPLTPQEWAESWGLLCLPPLLTCPLPSPGVTLERPQGRGHRSWTGRPARQTASHRRVRGGETRAGDQGFLAAAVPADYNQAGAQMRQAGAHPPPTPGQPDAPSLPRHPARSLPA